MALPMFESETLPGKLGLPIPGKCPVPHKRAVKILKYFLFSSSSLVRFFPQEMGYFLLDEGIRHLCINT